MNVIPSFKHCTECKRTLHIELFSIDKSSKDGHYKLCRECDNMQKKDRREQTFEERSKHPEIYPHVSRCGKRFVSVMSRSAHEKVCNECKKLKNGSKAVSTQTDEPTFMSHCYRSFTSRQERDKHELTCEQCKNIPTFTPLDNDAKTELPFDKDTFMENDTAVATNGLAHDEVTSTSLAQSQLSHTAKPEPTQLPLFVKVGSRRLAIAHIISTEVRKDNTVHVITSALQVTNRQQTESVAYVFSENEGVALLSAIDPSTLEVDSGLLERYQMQSTELQAAQREAREAKAEQERLSKECEAAMDLALQREQELTNIKARLHEIFG